MHLEALHAEHLNRQARQNMDRLQRRSIQELLESLLHRGVVILGDPGAGKSTLLRYQALRAARLAAPSASEPACLPIFVPLAAYDDYTQRLAATCTLGDFLAIYYDKWHSLPGLAPVFQGALEAGRALLLLDGLDEVLDAVKRQFVAAQVEALLRQWAPRGNRFALTSRIVGYREARLPGALPHVTILDFGRPEMTLFARQWCRTYEIWAAGAESATVVQRATTEAQLLLHDVQSNPSVERLAASPLLLTMLALLRRHVGQLPDRRIDLYASYVRTLLDNWQITRSRGARQHMPDRFDPHMAIAVLIDLAFWLQQHKPSGTARRQELEQVLEDICLRLEGHDPVAASPKEHLQAQQTAARFLHDMRQFAGLLAERGRDAFGFLHLTFQEYFAGRALARLPAAQRWAVLVPHLHRPRWREPILLCAGQLGVLEQRRDEVSDLAERILQAHSPYEPILHRDLFLAAAFAADDVGLSNALLDALTSQLCHLQESNIPTVRDMALGGLAQLARLENEPALDILLEALQSPAIQVHVIRGVTTVLHAETCARLRQAIAAKLDDEGYNVRQAAVQALAGLVATDPGVRQALAAKLDGERYDVRQAAVQALAGLVATDPGVRQALAAKLDGERYPVRQAAVQALAGLVATDPGVRQAIAAKLDDEHYNVRQAAVQALVEVIRWDANLAQRLLPWLGTVTERDFWDLNSALAREVKHTLANAYAGLAAQHPAWLAQIANLLTSFSWETREGAVWTCLAMPGGPPATLRPALLGVLDDLRTEASWPERLQVCAIFLNARDRALSTRAITLALEALDYATQPWYDLPRTGPPVRQQAARILGQLEPLYYDERIFARLARVLTEDNDAEVRDAAYQALLRLAVAPEEAPQERSAGLAVEVEMLQGGSMVVGKLADLVLQVHNRRHEILPKIEIQLIESGEYDIASANPVLVNHLAPQSPQHVTFRICPHVARLLPLQYTVNRALRTLPLSVNVIQC